MSSETLRQLLVDKLGKEDAERFTSDQIQMLCDKGYTDERMLQGASREGLRCSPGGLPEALIDMLRTAFRKSGERPPSNTLSTCCMVQSVTLVSLSHQGLCTHAPLVLYLAGSLLSGLSKLACYLNQNHCAVVRSKSQVFFQGLLACLGWPLSYHSKNNTVPHSFQDSKLSVTI